MSKVDILSLPMDVLTKEITDMRQPAFRAKQIFNWLHQKNAVSFSEMTNLSKELRKVLEDTYFIDQLVVEKKQVSKDGTTKYLFKLHDDNFIETVVMKHHYGTSVCVSTQVGCRMGCSFCASTKNGLVRNLTAAEILLQVYYVERELEEINSIVLMGIGEPLDNFENVVQFLKNISDENGRNLGQRNITLSTCGIVEGIDKLAEYHFGLTLTVSLHAPFDDMRSKMMPINNRYNITQVLDACKRYQKKTGRRISFEYTLIENVNDSVACAEELKRILKGLIAHVNLIPLNPIDGSTFSANSEKALQKFAEELEKRKIPATIRRRLGEDISAACGQLRAETVQDR